MRALPPHRARQEASLPASRRWYGRTVDRSVPQIYLDCGQLGSCWPNRRGQTHPLAIVPGCLSFRHKPSRLSHFGTWVYTPLRSVFEVRRAHVQVVGSCSSRAVDSGRGDGAERHCNGFQPDTCDTGTRRWTSSTVTVASWRRTSSTVTMAARWWTSSTVTVASRRGSRTSFALVEVADRR